MDSRTGKIFPEKFYGGFNCKDSKKSKASETALFVLFVYGTIENSKRIIFEEISMTGKQKAMAAIGIVFLFGAFVFLYRQFSTEGRMMSITPPTSSPSPDEMPQGIGETVKSTPSTPSTPDSIVDDILQNDAELSVIGDEEDGEIRAANESVQIIDDLSNSYEE